MEGAVTLLLPLSILRPCCAREPVDGAPCCTMPEACWLTGALLGLSLAIALPRGSRRDRFEAALGATLGIASAAALRCASLFAGEALGLAAGLVAGVIAAGLARAWIDRLRVRA
jgi:hypothetical protein